MKNKSGLTLIKKANNLIESRYKFDIWETRIFLSVLAQIHKDDKDFQAYRIYYKDIIKMFDLSSNQAHKLLREGANALMNKKLYIPYNVEGAIRETQYHLIRTINYLKELNENQEEVFLENQEFIDVTVDPDMKPLLLQLREQGGFTFYELKNIVKLSVYSLRIYELLKQYQKIGWRKLSVEEIKRTFELENEYALFGHFYSRIVAPSIKEINKHTDLQVDAPQKIKEGRKTVALLFTFRKKEDSLIAKPEPTIDFKNEVEAGFETITSSAKPVQPSQAEKQYDVATNSTIAPSPSIIPAPEPIKETSNYDALYAEFEGDVVKGFGVTPFVLFNLIQTYDAELIRKQIRITKRKRGASPTSNIAGFFVNAVKTDYNDPVEAKEEKKRENQRQNEAKQRAEQQRKQFIEEYNELTSMITTSTNNTIRKLVANDPTLTPRAIEYAKTVIINNVSLFHEIQQKGYDLDTVDLNTWRLEPLLRVHVLEAIKKLEPNAFSFLKSLHNRVAELEVEIEILPQPLQFVPHLSGRRGAA
jgi:plasmid replication initiation protein